MCPASILYRVVFSVGSGLVSDLDVVCLFRERTTKAPPKRSTSKKENTHENHEVDEDACLCVHTYVAYRNVRRLPRCGREQGQMPE